MKCRSFIKSQCIFSCLPLILSGMLTLATTKVSAQIPMLDVQATWNIHHTGYINYANEPWKFDSVRHTNYRLSTSIDTVINGLDYTFLNMTQTYTYRLQEAGAMLGPVIDFDTLDYNFGHVAALRNDGYKTYLYKLSHHIDTLIGTYFPDTTDRLLYDFGLEVGDSLFFTNFEGGESFSVVQNKYIVEFPGDIERIGLTMYQDYGKVLYLCQGIGEYFSGLFESLAPVNSLYTGELTCYQENGEVINGIDECTEPTYFFIDYDDPNPVYGLWPNPFREELHFAFGNDVSSLAFYNMAMQMVGYSHIENKEGHISTSHLDEGMYIVVCTYPNGNIDYYKLIKY